MYYQSQPLGPQVANTENIRTLRSYLNLKARIKATDGRIFLGTFMCIDKDKNIILAQTDEYRGVSPPPPVYLEEKRFVGLVMIPGKHLVKVEIEDLEVSDKYV
ncbi:hypothetical protein K493DRAFT_236290 [Basidiobolus meristosporus CBS 931.73]|uniref:Sm domain-containing protein n=1 Tax=Basidiobolus meristosporus CBS 931.73 TaxID=1314790 RepID=A0A1Y1XSR2_9FUNG|nr:hypothetical protein K493DRAFT_236290 [Basidiobolus meristosporus CBS 931.73]|eukprot:ORX88536.1 hypothetical protein K493DRAFT_236290 [Basidiobolus meristosporus CBS 931.73]